MAILARIHRHPVKSLGWEAVAAANLAEGRGLPWDRVWAVAHGRAAIDPDLPEWAPCENFLIVSVCPRLMPAQAAYDPDAGLLTLTHADTEPLTADPDAPAGASAIANWAARFAGPGPEGPYRLVRAPVPMHDTDYVSVSIGSLASLRALSQRMGLDLDPRRFRANLWIDGFAPWEENGWGDSEIAVGAARLRIVERIERCAATETSPETGRRDAKVRAALHEAVGAADFGVYATVVAGGPIRVGDPVTLL